MSNGIDLEPLAAAFSDVVEKNQDVINQATQDGSSIAFMVTSVATGLLFCFFVGKIIMNSDKDDLPKLNM